jgi:hypothetical protein
MGKASSPVLVPVVPAAAHDRLGADLTSDLQRLRRQLAVVVDGALAAPTHPHLEDLSAYLVNELNPVVTALALRVYPCARRLGVTGPHTRTASERARLLRLTELLAVIDADQASGNDRATVVEEIDSLAADLLLRALGTLPTLLDRLAESDAAHVVGAAQRTARAGRNLPHLELEPALL